MAAHKYGRAEVYLLGTQERVVYDLYGCYRYVVWRVDIYIYVELGHASHLNELRNYACVLSNITSCLTTARGPHIQFLAQNERYYLKPSDTVPHRTSLMISISKRLGKSITSVNGE